MGITGLSEKLEAHRRFLCGVEGGRRFDLSKTDRISAEAPLTGYGVNLSETDLTRANLAGAGLTGANLTGANLTGAGLTGAELTRANLTGANLRGADLRVAVLYGANLTWANLVGAKLFGANLLGTNLTGARLPEFQLCPPKGKSFRAWKKVRGGFILELEIPEGAERTSSLVSRKCRASRARVVSAKGRDGDPSKVPEEFLSCHDPSFTYRLGEVVAEPRYNGDIRFDCAPGVHFFMTRKEAVAYLGGPWKP